MHARNPSRAQVVVVAAAMVGLSLGCSASVGGSGAPAQQTVAVAVEPGAITLAPAQGTQFAAAVTGTADTAVTWRVDEASGGTVDQAGNYVAPAAAGTFHVRAVAHADSSVSGAATVTVQAPPAGTVVISPRTTSVLTGGTVNFTATLTGLTGGVTYAVQEASGCGSVTSAGVYTAPAAAATCHVVATSTADTTRKDTATVTVTAPVVVTLNASTGAVDACRTLAFTATVTGTSNTAVTWSVAEGSAGGSVSTTGVYTAPSNAGTYHVVATSNASSSSSARATVTVTERIVSVAVNPTTSSLATGGTQQFTATVTTSCGTFVAAGP